MRRAWAVALRADAISPRLPTSLPIAIIFASSDSLATACACSTTAIFCFQK